jgi:molybdenum cofactor cytidylyltransferase
VIAIVVLAAGKSSRSAPENKLLTPAVNGTLIGQTVDHAVSSGGGPVIVVTGHQAAQIENALSERPVRFVHAADYAEGIAASLRAGIAALDRDADGALICLGDMPLVEPFILRRIVQAFDPAQGCEIVLPTYAGERGNPVLWGKRFFPELLQLSGDSGGGRILHLHKPFIIEVPVEHESVRLDFDTKQELEKFKSDSTAM